MSARALSLRSGLSESYLGKLERGECEPSLRTFSRLATALSLSHLEVAIIVTLEAAGDVTHSAYAPSIREQAEAVA